MARPCVVYPLKAPAVENFAWLPVGSNSNKTGRGSVSLILAGFQVALFFGRPTLPRKWGTNIDKTDFFSDVGDLAPKARKPFFLTKVRSQRAHFFVYRRPQGIYVDLASQSQREQTTGTPPLCFPSVVSPIW